MSRLSRGGLVVAGVAAIVLLFLAFRPGGGDEEGTPVTATTAPTTTTTATTTTGPRTTAIELAVKNGRVAGGPQVHRVRQGALVVLAVEADVEDGVHVHGYDLMRDVAPGSPARLRFRAGVPGRFEMELEGRKLPLGELEVRP